MRRPSARRVDRLLLAPQTDVLDVVDRLRPATLLLDVEPYVAAWGSGQAALDEGLAGRLAELASLEQRPTIVFVTNSARLPAVANDGLDWRRSARKPLVRRADFSTLPRPLVVVGDQAMTDGLLAWRLGVPFVQIALPQRSPAWIRAQRLVGALISPLFFRDTGA